MKDHTYMVLLILGSPISSPHLCVNSSVTVNAFYIFPDCYRLLEDPFLAIALLFAFCDTADFETIADLSNKALVDFMQTYNKFYVIVDQMNAL
jgi:hypothetical protein